MSLTWSILGKAFAHPSRLAVQDDQRTYTFKQLLGGALFLAERIDAATSAAHVGIILPTSGAFPVALLGCWLARRVAVPLNYLLNRDELAYVIADSRIDTIITAGPMLKHLGGASGENILPPHIKTIKIEELDFTGLPPLRWPPLVSVNDLAAILYTSGTSGKPKGVMLSHGNLESNVQAALEHARITAADGFLSVLPQFHSFGLTAMTLLPLYAGAKVIYSARFTPRRVVELIRTHKPDIFMAVPSMYNALLAVKDANAGDLSSVRIAVSGGEALPAALADAFHQRFNVRLFEGYGLTETSPVVSWCTTYAWKPKSIGTALPGVEVVIVDANDRPVPPGAEGELLIRGPNVMRGYWQLPEATREVITASIPGREGERFFRTGDLGRRDADGFLSITGRKKEVFKVAGEMVAPREVEETLNQHPSVRASAVVPKPDETRGLIPVAFVEINEGATFDETALRTWCRERLANFKVPREINHIEQLPRNATGKILRRQLKID